MVGRQADLLSDLHYDHHTPAMAQASQRTYALKRMRKSSVVQCPEHVFCEQSITSNTAHPFCIRQYSSFQVPACHQSFRTPWLCTTCGQDH
jgi:hypothetical protein